MKKYVTIIGCIAIGLIIGLLIPWTLYVECNGSILNVCTHGFWDWTLRILQVCGTLGAVVVALFKEWFYKRIYHPSFTIKTSGNDIKEKIDENNNVSQYYSHLLITNNGSASAVNSELYMSRLEYTSQNGAINNTIIDVDSRLLWADSEKRIDMPQTFTQSVEWFKVMRGIPKSENTDAIPPQLIIGTKQIPKDMSNGCFTVVFKVVSTGIPAKEIKIKLSWNGQWQDHLSQMKTCLQYEVLQ